MPYILTTILKGCKYYLDVPVDEEGVDGRMNYITSNPNRATQMSRNPVGVLVLFKAGDPLKIRETGEVICLENDMTPERIEESK